MSTKALIHVKTCRHPRSEDIIGFRLEAAIPNKEGRVMKARHSGDGEVVGFYATGEPAPSFKKPYFIRESSDYSRIGKKQVEKFQEDLRWNGYREFEYVGKYEGEPLEDLMR